MDFSGISHYDPTVGASTDDILLYDGEGTHYAGADFVPVAEHFGENFTEAEFQETHTVLADGGDRFGVSAVAFDLQEELLWMGNQGGHLTSYYGLGMQKYTSFQVHSTQEIRHIHPFETGVLALSQTSLRCQMRRGIPIFTYSSDSMEDMQCMLQISPTTLLMGGHQDKLIEFDIAKVAETNVMSVGENGCAILRQQASGGRFICCGDPTGRIHLRDPYTLRVEHTLESHTGSLSDLDVHANMLVTCGFSSRHGVMSVDRFMMSYDLRMMRALTPITLALDPLLLRFLPLFSSRVAIVSNLGQVQLLDTAALTQPGDMCVFQVNTAGAMCLAFDVSSSCQCLAFGDGGGSVHLFNSGGAHASFNSFSQETEFADPVESIPPINILDENTPLSTVPFPLCSTSALLSDWPERFLKPTFRRTPAIDPQILQTMKMVGTVGYAPNPGNRRRNQVPYKLEKRGRTHKAFPNDTRSGKLGDDGSSFVAIPRRYRKIEVKYSKMGADDFDFDLYNRTGFCGLEATLPNSYCNPMLQILHYLDPVRSVLLSHLCQKEFCLSCELGFLFHMLDISHGFPCQASNFLRAFRTIPEASALGLILSDQGDSKKKTDLIRLIQSWNRFILHQMHFEILEEKKRKQFENQQMYLRSESPVVTDQFVYKEKDFPSISGDQVHKPDKNSAEEDKENTVSDDKKAKEKPEIGEENPNEETDISRLFGTKMKNINKCLKCGREVIKESSLLLCNLIYPDVTSGKNNKEYNFSDILLQSLCPEQTTPAWCDDCSRYQPTHQSRRIQALPNILVNNCGMESQKDKTFWQTQMDSLVQKAQQNVGNNDDQTNANVKQCRYGSNCTRAGCRFRHVGRTGETKSVTSSHLYYTHSWLPLHIQIDLTEGGSLKIRKIDPPANISSKTKPKDFKDDDEEDANGKEKLDGESSDKNSETKSGKVIQSVVYDLCSVVCHIHDQASLKDRKSHLVALVKAGPGYHIRSVGSPVSQWYIFNDFSIMPVVAQEVVWFNLEWKIPCVLYWMRSDLPSDFVSPIHNPISLDVFGEDKCLARNGGRKMITFTPLAADEIPGEGEIVAMDAEFVTLNQEEAELRSDGKMSTIKPSHMSVARITCIRGQGPLEGTPFIDDYISTQEQVVDYKTKFSGIKPGDLDANFSSKHLTTLKSTYQKLRFLVDNGVKFVGHGLKNDFRVINLVVPAEQVMDTVLLFHLPHHRMVSLRFLAWHFLATESWERLQPSGLRPQPRAESVALAVSQLLLHPPRSGNGHGAATPSADSHHNQMARVRPRGGGSVDRSSCANNASNSGLPSSTRHFHCRVSPCEPCNPDGVVEECENRIEPYENDCCEEEEGEEESEEVREERLIGYGEEYEDDEEEDDCQWGGNGRRRSRPRKPSVPMSFAAQHPNVPQSNNNLSFLREISKISQINLSRLSRHNHCSYSVLSSDSSESICNAVGADHINVQSCALGCRKDHQEIYSGCGDTDGCMSTPGKMVKSQSANLITVGGRGKGGVGRGRGRGGRHGIGRRSQDGSDCMPSRLPRDPVSVPNFGAIQKPSIPPLTPVEMTRLVFLDTDEDEDGPPENETSHNEPEVVNDGSRDALIINSPAPPVTDFSVLHRQFQPSSGKKRSESAHHLSDSNTESSVIGGNGGSCTPVGLGGGIPKSASVRFRQQLVELEEASDETVSTSDYASIETVNCVNNSKAHTPSGMVINTMVSSVNGQKTGVAEEPDGPYGFSNPNYLGPDISTILSGNSSWKGNGNGNGSKGENGSSTRVQPHLQLHQTYAQLLNSPPDSVLEDSNGRSCSRFFQDDLELQSLAATPSGCSLTAIAPPTLLNTNPPPLLPPPPQLRSAPVPQFLSLHSPLEMSGPTRRCISATKGKGNGVTTGSKCRASSASRAECSFSSSGYHPPPPPPQPPPPPDPNVPLYMFVVGGKERGQVTLFRRPISVWRLQLAPDIY